VLVRSECILNIGSLKKSSFFYASMVFPEVFPESTANQSNVNSIDDQSTAGNLLHGLTMIVDSKLPLTLKQLSTIVSHVREVQNDQGRYHLRRF